ncbi:MAG: hypothetical protein ABIG61_07395 [Planctomycetota bacterium]
MTWREHCKPIIANIINTIGKDDMKTLRKALKEAYPYGQRKCYPYKTWCSEIRRQLKLNYKETEQPLFNNLEKK